MPAPDSLPDSVCRIPTPALPNVHPDPLKERIHPYLVQISAFDADDGRLLSRFSGFLYRFGSPSILTSSYPFQSLLTHTVRYRVRYHDGTECDAEKVFESVAMEMALLRGSRVAASDFPTAGLHRDERIYAFGALPPAAAAGEAYGGMPELQLGPSSPAESGSGSEEGPRAAAAPEGESAEAPFEVSMSVGQVTKTAPQNHLLWIYSGPEAVCAGGPIVNEFGELVALVYGAKSEAASVESEGLVKAVSADSVHAVLKFQGLDELV